MITSLLRLVFFIPTFFPTYALLSHDNFIITVSYHFCAYIFSDYFEDSYHMLTSQLWSVSIFRLFGAIIFRLLWRFLSHDNFIITVSYHFCVFIFSDYIDASYHMLTSQPWRVTLFRHFKIKICLLYSSHITW